MSDVIVSYLNKLFGIPTTILEWPLVLPSLIIPLLLFTYAMKLLLEEIRIFYSETINWAIAFVISFASLLFISYAGPIFAGMAIFMICFFKLHGTKGILTGVIVGGLYAFFIHPLLITYLA